MWVWQSIMPGSTVARDKSITLAPAGTLPPMLSILLSRMTITWLWRTAFDVPPMSVPARITVAAVGWVAFGVACCAAAEAIRQANRLTNANRSLILNLV